MDRRRLAVVLATWFFAGRSPVAPGTVGSLCAWAVASFAAHSFGVPAWTFSVAAVALLPVAVWSAGTASEAIGSDDPPSIVIDEVIGMWIAIAPVATGSWPQWIAAIALFRAFDITKPFGMRRLERFAGGRGIVADDLAAGACAMIGTLVVRWAGF